MGEEAENTTNCIYHLNPDTFKDSSPDLYQPMALGKAQFESKHNTSLEIELALRNNTMGSEQNNSNSNNNELSRKTLSQEIYNPNSVHTANEIQELENTENTHHVFFNGSIEEENGSTNRGVLEMEAGNTGHRLERARPRNERLFGDEYTHARNGEILEAGNINKHSRYYEGGTHTRPKSLSINPVRSHIEI